MLIVIEIDGIQSKQLVKRTIDGHIPRLKLTNNDLQLLVESGVGLENGKQFFGDEEDSCVDLFFDVDVMLADLVLEGLNTRNDVIGKRDWGLLEDTEEVDIDAEEGMEDVADLVEMFLDASGR